MNEDIKNLYNEIFLSSNCAMEFLNLYRVFRPIETSPSCLQLTNRRIKDKTRLNNCYYFCSTCKKIRTSIWNSNRRFQKTFKYFSSSSLWIFGKFRLLPIAIINRSGSQNIFKNKKTIINKIRSNSEILFEKIGGLNIQVQIDEMAICRGRIIENPSSTLDETPGIQWLIEGIEVSESRNCFFEMIPDHTSSTFLDVSRRKIYTGTVMVTDGHPSYPSAVENFGSVHIIVPHNQGFVNSDGHHTNLIENLWSYLKTEYRDRRGVQVSRMADFIYEFYFRKIY